MMEELSFVFTGDIKFSKHEEDRKNHFMDPDRLYRMPEEALDFTVIYPLTERRTRK